MKGSGKKSYFTPVIEKMEFDGADTILTSDSASKAGGNGDVGKGKGRGGGCDGEPYHPNQKTFSNGRKSGCK